MALAPIASLFIERRLPTLRDEIDFFLPMAFHTASSLRSGELPLWNAHNFAGEPWLAAVQPGVLYPPTFLHLAVPHFPTAHRMLLLFHRLLLVAGLYRLSRRIGLAREASLLAAALAALGSPLASVACFENNFRTLAWFPWVLDAAIRASRGLRFGAMSCGIFLALAFLAGEPELAALAALISVFVLMFPPGSSLPRWKRLRSIGLVGLVAFLLSAPTLLPFLEFWRESDRGALLPAAEASRQSLSPGGLVELALGPIWGVPEVDPVPPSRQTYFYVLSLGAAATIFLFAGVSICFRAENRKYLRWIVLPSGILLAAIVPSLLACRLPFRYPIRLVIPVVIVGAPILIAMAWSFVRRGEGPSFVFPGVAALMVILFLGWFLGGDRVTLFRATIAGGGALALFKFPSIRAVPVLAAFLLIGDAAGLAMMVPSRSASDFEAVAPPALAEDMDRLRPGTRVIADPPEGRALESLVVSPGKDPWMVRSRSLGFGYSNLLGRSSSVRGGGPILVRRYENYFGVALRPGRYEPLLGALRVGGALSMIRPPLSGLRAVKAADGVTWFDWDRAAPRAWMVGQWTIVPGEKEALRAIAEPAFDPRTTAVVERRGGVEAPLPPAPDQSSGAGEVIVLAETSGSLDLRTERKERGLLIVPDAFYPGWSAIVDGKPAPIVPVDSLFRGVFLPKGSHEVRFSYRPSSFHWGLALGAMGMLGCCASFAAGRRVSSAGSAA